MLRAEIVGSHGVVASSHWAATTVAVGVLEAGGNAFDAAVACGFALHAVQPHQNGPGGEAPAVFWSASEQRARVLSGQGPAPAAASIEVFAGLGLDRVPGTGLLAATVPAAVGSWLLLLEHYGSWELRDVLAPAIGIMTTGFSPGAQLVATLDEAVDMFAAHWPSSHAQWAGARADALAGRLVRNPALADCYTRLLAEARGPSREARILAARRAWYEGFVAEAVDRSMRTPRADSSGEPHGGLLTGDDLAGWRPTLEEPVGAGYRDWQLWKPGAWSQGPVLLQQLAMLEGWEPSELEPGSADAIHLVTEVSKLAFADREAWYGDSQESREALPLLLDPEYARRRRSLVTDRASSELRPGRPGGRAPRLPQYRHAVPGAGGPAGTGEPTRLSSRNHEAGPVYGDTCHLDVADRWGNVVSATPSGGWLQSSPAVEDLGFSLGTRAQMFWLEPGLPSSLEPGRRPRTTLSPTLAQRDGESLSFGTPGGDQQDQWTLTVFLGVADHGLSLREALALPRHHSEHAPSSFYPREALPNRLVVEAGIAPEVRESLRARGHEVEVVDDGSLGKVTMAAGRNGRLRAAADARSGEPSAAGR